MVYCLKVAKMYNYFGLLLPSDYQLGVIEELVVIIIIIYVM